MPTTTIEALDLPRIRATLGARRVTRKQLAQAAGLSHHYVCMVLNGHPCGELAQIKLRTGLERLGLDGPEQGVA